ncbi:unnamed protein product [Rotaria sp. Silwood1]|nr:unnamed protein product [Rotaria sp. Silwood1]
MSIDWTTKEKIVLISDILEYGDQLESWSSISNDLSRTFQTNIILSQAKREGRYSIKNCKQEYKYLVNRYKSQWIEHGSSNNLKLPLAKYIWIQLKSIYQTELTQQLNESRKKLTEFCLRLESAVNIKSNTIEPILPPSITEITTPVATPQQDEPQEEKTPIIEIISEVNFAKPKQKTSGSSKEHSLTSSNWKTTSSSDRSHRIINNHYQSLGFSTPPTARRQHLSGFSSLSSTPTRSTTTNNYHRYYL